MMKLSIDLGQTYEGSPCVLPTPEDGKTKHYPSFHYDGPEPLELPEEGVLTVKFRKTGSSVSTNRDGKKHYSCSVDVEKILGVESEKSEVEAPFKRQTGAEDALDVLMAALVKKSDESY